ncbi:MAG: ATP-binding cassette domain-containing protein [Caldisericia bacterium]|nr:ATP-binding cassette domain-containing protein [Caldisericia bacterium]MDD4614954.1 ATP-binding cassette domain-containing protein [Caldisericia bacterium]
MNVEFKAISKYFQDQTALENVNFHDDVSSLAIIGPSGGGKSTLLRIMGGLISPSHGELLVDGRQLRFDRKSLQAYHKKVGFVFQSNGLFEHMTALENVTLPLVQSLGMDRKEAVHIADSLFERFGLHDQRSKHPYQMSGGQQQRVSIARAVSVKPVLLLLDEPTSALDPEYTADVLDMLRELQKEGLKTMIVTHEMGFAKHACEKLLFLSHHTVVEYGYSNDVFKNPKTHELQSFLDLVLEWKV